MKIQLEIDDITLFATALNNAIVSYGDVVFAIMLGCEVPSKLQPLKKIPFDKLEGRLACLKAIYKQIEKIETDMKETYMKQKEIVSVDNIGQKVNTIYGIGTLVDVDGGGAYWVDIDGEFEQIRDSKDISRIETDMNC